MIFYAMSFVMLLVRLVRKVVCNVECNVVWNVVCNVACAIWRVGHSSASPKKTMFGAQSCKKVWENGHSQNCLLLVMLLSGGVGLWASSFNTLHSFTYIAWSTWKGE